MQTAWSDNVSIRRMRTGDVPAVRDLERCEPSAWSRPLIMAELGRQDTIQIIACRDDLVVGWCCARFVGVEAELLKIGVLAEHRRKKISSRLLRHVEKQLCKRGIAALFLEVRSRNDSAISFYHAAGFTEVARRIRYYTLPYDDALLYRKTLINE